MNTLSISIVNIYITSIVQSTGCWLWMLAYAIALHCFEDLITNTTTIISNIIPTSIHFIISYYRLCWGLEWTYTLRSTKQPTRNASLAERWPLSTNLYSWNPRLITSYYYYSWHSNLSYTSESTTRESTASKSTTSKPTTSDPTRNQEKGH